GEFGLTASWPDNRDRITAIICGDEEVIGDLIDALLMRAHPELVQRRDALLEWIVGPADDDLLQQVDAAAALPSARQDLSQHLAERGILPMFGFPTRVRDMFLRRPMKAYPWPPRGTVDRQLELAVIDFAPGAETVRDKQVHTAVGLAGYRPA